MPIVHIIWNDGKYNMVEFQEEMKYGRSSGVDFGSVDFCKNMLAVLGQKGYRVDSRASFEEIFKEALKEANNGPV